MTIVADASPLIALAQVNQLPLLERLFCEILVPPAVVREVELPLPAFIRERKLSRPIRAAVLSASLDPGESEAISLALELGADRVILDERAARRLAHDLALPCIGVLGILLASKQKGRERAAVQAEVADWADLRRENRRPNPRPVEAVRFDV